MKTTISNILINFNKFTHTVEKFVDNEKKIFSKIIKEFWIEHQITDLLKISILLLLILWLFFLIYFDVSHTNVTYDDLAEIKNSIDEIVYVNKAQAEIIEIQSEKIKQLSSSVRQYKPGKYEFAVAVVLVSALGVGYIAGFVTMLAIAAAGS